MTAKKRQSIILAVFLATVIWGIYNLTGEKQNNQAAIPNQPQKAPLVRSNQLAGPIDIEKQSKLEWGSDPFFRNPGTSSESPATVVPPNWVLGGILYDRDNPSAIINHTIVRGGDFINGARVVQIDKSSVRLEKNGLQFTLTVGKEKS